jgi:hypothetical protein
VGALEGGCGIPNSIVVSAMRQQVVRSASSASSRRHCRRRRRKVPLNPQSTDIIATPQIGRQSIDMEFIEIVD